MSDQNSVETSVETLVAPAPRYRTVGSGFQASTGATPQMTFVWTATVASGDQAAIHVHVRYGGGTATDNEQKVEIPWGWTGAVPLSAGRNPAISVSGSVSAAYSTDGSAAVMFNGNMVYGGVNNIVGNGAIVATCLALR